jgi:hypothetical protein
LGLTFLTLITKPVSLIFFAKLNHTCLYQLILILLIILLINTGIYFPNVNHKASQPNFLWQIKSYLSISIDINFLLILLINTGINFPNVNHKASQPNFLCQIKSYLSTSIDIKFIINFINQYWD